MFAALIFSRKVFHRCISNGSKSGMAASLAPARMAVDTRSFEEFSPIPPMSTRDFPAAIFSIQPSMGSCLISVIQGELRKTPRHLNRRKVRVARREPTPMTTLVSSPGDTAISYISSANSPHGPEPRPLVALYAWSDRLHLPHHTLTCH